MNIFFCSQKNHIKIFSKLITDKKIKNNHAVLLYTKRNIQALEGMKELISVSIFNSHTELELPLLPLRFDLRNFYKLKKLYTELLSSIQANNIFVVSFEYHYAILCATAKNLNIQTNLVEEGTATYKYLVKDYHKKDKIHVTDIIDSVYLKLWKQTLFGKYVLKPLYYAIIDIFITLKAIVLTLPEVILHEYFQKKILKAFPFIFRESNVFSKGNFAFDNTYTSFPHLTRKIFSSEKFEQFFPHSLSKNKNHCLSRIKSGSYIYVSQPYKVNKEIYYPEIISILDIISRNDNAHIYIKLHPRESIQIHSYLKNYLLSMKEDISIFILESDYQSSVEDLLINNRFSKIIGLTSTALVYAKIVSPNIDSISIVDEFLLRMDKFFPGNNTAIKEIKKHREVINIFDSVKHHNPNHKK